MHTYSSVSLSAFFVNSARMPLYIKYTVTRSGASRFHYFLGARMSKIYSHTASGRLVIRVPRPFALLSLIRLMNVFRRFALPPILICVSKPKEVCNQHQVLMECRARVLAAQGRDLLFMLRVVR
jgi:hypothetical protein